MAPLGVTTVVAPSPNGPDALYAAFSARAAALNQGAVGAADALAADIVVAEITTAAFKPLARAIGKSTGLDGDEFLKRMLKARAAREAAANGNAQAGSSSALEPADNPAPLSKLLDAVATVFRRQVWTSEEAITAATLWVIGTYGYETADVYARLAFTSEMRRCGKSTALSTVALLAFAAELADNISPAAMFRLIASKRMSLCIDELDSFGRDDHGLRNMLNAGYARTGSVKRAEATPDGKSYAVVEFGCYCPVAIAGIGGLPDTVLDRSVLIRLQRAPKAQTQQKRRLRYREMLAYRDKIVPHLLAHAPAISAAIGTGAATMPAGLDDRALDKWDPLFAVAELAGGGWPARATDAAIQLSGPGTERAGLVEKLLEDIRDIVSAPQNVPIPTEIRSDDLLVLLHSLTHRPWGEASHGKPITPRWLSDRLRGLGVTPGRGRVGEWPFDANGEPRQTSIQSLKSPLPLKHSYAVSDLRAAWQRCL
jgi:hypothetical protein